MKTKSRILMMTAMLTMTCVAMQAQFNKRLNNAVKNAAENAAVRQAEKRTEQAVDKAIDDAFDPNKKSGKNKSKDSNNNANTGNAQGNANESASTGGNPSSASAAQTPQQGGNTVEMAYAKSDFVAGDEIFFEDLMENEQIGEFPSMWDLTRGVAEIAAVNGKKAIVRGDKRADLNISPLMKDMKNYLPEKFTLEMDLWITKEKSGDNNTKQEYSLHFYDVNGTQVMGLSVANLSSSSLSWGYRSTSDQSIGGDAPFTIDFDGWHHLSISFNQRAFKAYMDGVRIANIPNMQQPARFMYRHTPVNGAMGGAITNVRLAKGAVPLYDRMLTDGKFITYGITFDVGKSTIKPESMGEITRIATLMSENPDLKFSVEGHTDSTGNATSNQTLSEARSQAVVDKLVENGIARTRLTAAGKGQTAPIADNGTDEGRAKNRRVEFVKIN